MKSYKYQIIRYPFKNLPREMTASEAKEYFDWFLSIISDRINKLEAYVQSFPSFSEWVASYDPRSLKTLGIWFENSIEIRNQTEQELTSEKSALPESLKQHIDHEGWEFTSKTLSLIYDVGIYLGQTLIENQTQLTWGLVKGGKTFVDFQQPVIRGPGKATTNPVENVRILAYGIVRKKKAGQDLKTIYDFVKKDLLSW